MKGAEFRPRPIGLPNFSPDGVRGSSGKGHLRLLPGAIPLGEAIDSRQRPGARRRTEQAKPTLGQEINAYLVERARLRAVGQLPIPEGKPPIVTHADAISLDLFAYDLEVGSHSEDIEKARRVSRICWGFDALAFGLLSHAVQEYVTIGYEFTQGFNRNYLHIFEERARLNGEDTVILAEQFQKVGLPFQALPQGITIPFAPTVQAMRKMVGGEPLFLSLPPSNIRYIKHSPKRDR